MSQLREVKHFKRGSKRFICGSYGDVLHEALLPINKALKLHGLELVTKNERDDCYHLVIEKVKS